MDMPVINMDALKANLSEKDYAIAALCVSKRNGEWRLRASKPSDAVASYVWRMAAFVISPISAHQCMPVGADAYIREQHFSHRTDTYQPNCKTDEDREFVAGWNEEDWARMNRSVRHRAFLKEELDPISDALINTVDKSKWAGVLRWGRALGAF